MPTNRCATISIVGLIFMAGSAVIQACTPCSAFPGRTPSRHLIAAAHRRGCDRWRSWLVSESTYAEVPQTLIASYELPVRKRSAEPDALCRALVARDDAERWARRIR